MGIELEPFQYGHVAGRQYNRRDIVLLGNHVKSSNGTDVIMRTMWVCIEDHLSTKDSLEKGCWELLHNEEFEVNEKQ